MKKGHSFDAIATLLLFSLFAACVVLVLMSGVKTYQAVVQSMEESYGERTCLQYIATKVDHVSGTGSVTLSQFGDGTALALTETFDGCDYVTYLYVCDGVAMELFCEKGMELDPETGFAIMEVEELSMEEVSVDLLRITCTAAGGTAQILVGLHNGRGATS